MTIWTVSTRNPETNFFEVICCCKTKELALQKTKEDIFESFPEANIQIDCIREDWIQFMCGDILWDICLNEYYE